MRKFGLLGSSALRSAVFIGAAISIAAPSYAQTPTTQPGQLGDEEGVTEAEKPENLGQNEVELESGQDAPENPEQGGIVVTGSRIRSPNLTSSIPITSVGVQELTDQGSVSLGDALNDLPSLRSTFSQSNSTRFIGTAGLSLLDLRGLGTARTLVLVNGRRHVPAQPGSSNVDVNTIPTDLIERVDVVTGGNSAIYGSDAVAGVVNFVLKRDFEGIRVRAQGGISDRGDRGSYFTSLTAGRNFADNRGNVAVSLEYSRQEEVLFAQRDPELGTLRGTDGFIPTELTLGEPPEGNGIPDTTFLRNIKSNTNALGGLFQATCPAAPARGETQAAFQARRAAACTGTFLPGPLGGGEIGRTFVFDNAGNLGPNDCVFDFRPRTGTPSCVGGQGITGIETSQLFPELDRYAANLLASFEISPALRPFIEAKYVRVDSLQRGQPTFTGGTLSASFSINNPFLTPQARSFLQTALAPGTTTFLSRRFSTDIGARGEDHRRETYRIVAGIDGTFNDDWRYEVAFNYGRLDTFYETAGNVHLQRFGNAANALRNARGEIVCAINADTNPANDDPNCVPLNLFGSGRSSQAAIDYVTVTSFRNEEAEQYNAIGFVSGDTSQLFELPGGPVAFALGAEYRRETASSVFDPLVSNPVRQTFLNAIAPFNPPALEIKEAFGELNIPLLRDMPFFRELTIQAAGRVSDYNVGQTGTVFAYNVGGTWTPVRDIRFRAGYARSVRAPTLGNLFSSETQTFLIPTDPCDQRFINQNPNRVRNCAAAGVPTTEINPATGLRVPFTNQVVSSIAGANRGNPDLREETGKSLTVGFVAQPRVLPGFSLSVDYYDIEVENVIFALAGQTVINQCFDDPGGINNQFCAAVNRRTTGPFAGTFAGQFNKVVGGVTLEIPGPTSPSFFQQPFNFARLETSGIDVDAAYRTRLGGNVTLNLRGILSWVEKRNSFSVVTDPNFADRIKSELGDPEWSANFSANVDFGIFDVGYDLRWIGQQTIGAFEDQNSFQGRPPRNADAFPIVNYPSVFYHNFRLGFEPVERFKFYMGVDNAFDRLPPFGLAGTGAGSAIYEPVGRFFYAGAQVKF